MLDLVMDLSKTSSQRRWSESTLTINLDRLVLHRCSIVSLLTLASTDDNSTVTQFPIDGLDTTPGASRENIQPNSRGSISGDTLSQSPVTMSTVSSLADGDPLKPQSNSTFAKIESEYNDEDTRKSIVSVEGRTEITVFCNDLARNHKERLKSELSYDIASFFCTKAKMKQTIEIGHQEVPLACLLGTRDLKLKHRKMAQVFVARSLLFYPWGDDHIINKDTLFFMGNSDKHRYKPFTRLMPKHDDQDDRQEATFKCDFDKDFSVAPCSTLAELATLLLELELGKPIESIRTEEDLDIDGNPTINTNYFTASRYLEQNLDNMYPRIHSVIDTCLQCDFGYDQISLDNEEVLRDIYERIVCPLEKEFQTAFGSDLSHLEDEITDHPMRPNSHGTVTKKDQRTVTIRAPTDAFERRDIHVEFKGSELVGVPTTRPADIIRRRVHINVPDALSVASNLASSTR
jgi:hypothetical protein